MRYLYDDIAVEKKVDIVPDSTLLVGGIHGQLFRETMVSQRCLGCCQNIGRGNVVLYSGATR